MESLEITVHNRINPKNTINERAALVTVTFLATFSSPQCNKQVYGVPLTWNYLGNYDLPINDTINTPRTNRWPER